MKSPVSTFGEINSRQVNVGSIQIFFAQFQTLKLHKEMLNAANNYLFGIKRTKCRHVFCEFLVLMSYPLSQQIVCILVVFLHICEQVLNSVIFEVYSHRVRINYSSGVMDINTLLLNIALGDTHLSKGKFCTLPFIGKWFPMSQIFKI